MKHDEWPTIEDEQVVGLRVAVCPSCRGMGHALEVAVGSSDPDPCEDCGGDGRVRG